MLTRRIKQVLLRAIPVASVDWYRMRRYGRTWYNPKNRSVADVFSEIYRRGLWGKTDSSQPFNSGPGSDAEVAAPYIAAIHELVDERKITSVVDLGCGDFRVGSRLVRPDFTYCGLDIVKPLVDFNNERFASDKVSFRHANLITDELPAAQLCLIRQVLQHLSNEQVNIILNKCTRYPFVVVTEHLPDPALPWVPNRDIHHGNVLTIVRIRRNPDTRRSAGKWRRAGRVGDDRRAA